MPFEYVLWRLEGGLMVKGLVALVRNISILGITVVFFSGEIDGFE